MTNLIIQVSKYLIIILMALYTFQCYTVFQKKDEDDRNFVFIRQITLMFFMHFVAFTVLYLEIGDVTVLMFYGAQVVYLAATLILFRNIYPLASRLLINNMCMLISIGFIMITRISYEQSVKQFKIIVASTVVALIIPIIIRKLRFITKMYWFYTLMGIGLLALVAIMAQSTYGAKLSFTVGGVSIQPSEFVKIIFVFAIAGLLSNARDFKRIVIATGLAALHVLILVVSKDLGSALIFFITYLVMLFVATRNPFLVLAGILAGSVAAVGAYFLFAHIRVRVQAWQDPFQDYYAGGYQICQSLFSIAAGSWFGTGLYQGSPTAITFVEQDFMFSAVAEELGSIFGICLILVCMSCFIMFVNISMQLKNRFYRLVAVGLGSTYAVQVFLTIGGGIKLIPLTGVTLPLVSYGGSSALSTLIMFAIVQGLYMLHRDEEKKKAQELYEQEQAGGYGEYDYQAQYWQQEPYGQQNGYGPDDGYGPQGRYTQRREFVSQGGYGSQGAYGAYDNSGPQADYDMVDGYDRRGGYEAPGSYRPQAYHPQNGYPQGMYDSPGNYGLREEYNSPGNYSSQGEYDPLENYGYQDGYESPENYGSQTYDSRNDGYGQSDGYWQEGEYEAQEGYGQQGGYPGDRGQWEELEEGSGKGKKTKIRKPKGWKW